MQKKLLDLDSKQDGSINENDFKINKISRKDIAIIGMYAKFPAADSLDEFWSNIRSGIDCIRDFPVTRRGDTDRILRYMNVPESKIRYRKEAFLDEIDKFDHNFFRLSPKEASLIDPNQRLFLETAWKAIEDAGYGGGKLAGTATGVYVGFSSTKNAYKNAIDAVEPASAPMAVTGNTPAIIASRLSYLLDLKGTSMVVDTTCSSALVSLHLACQAIRSEECEMAVVGSVNINLMPAEGEGIAGVDSSDGRVRAFDDSSDGSGGGEGAGVVLLKPLYKALEDGDHIYSVIKGSATNQDGSSIGLTAPNVLAQEEVIVKAWKNAGVDPETITYIEAHGTGTKLGDPIEIQGITNAFRRYTSKKQFCAIGTVKTNIGHLNHAAGITGLIKAVLALKHGEIPPTLHFNKPNRGIRFEESPIYVNERLKKWKAGNLPRRCGVSAFGLSGTNCHVVLEEAPEIAREKSEEQVWPQILVLSARKKEILKELAAAYGKFARNVEDQAIRDICYTANTGRGHYSCRLALILNDTEDFRAKLESINARDFEDINKEGIYYCEHRFVPANKEKTEKGEITEKALKEISARLTDAIRRIQNSGPSKGALEELCRLYAMGADAEWDELYKGEKRRRVSLPVYPFERKRCWFDIPEPENRPEIFLQDELFFTASWEHSELKTGENNLEGGCVVIFMDRHSREKGLEIACSLREESVTAIEVEMGNCFEILGKDRYVVGNGKKDFEELFMDIKGRKPTHLLHFMAIGGPAGIRSVQDLDESQKRGVYSLLNIVQAAASSNTGELEVVLAAEYAYSVTQKEDSLRPENSTLFGLGKVAGIENLNLKFRYIDIDESFEAEHMISELKAGREEYMVAYRRGERFAEVIDKVNIQNKKSRSADIKEDGIYVIAGGTGVIGLEVSRYLAEKGKVNLALVNRTPFPERILWDDIVSRGDDPELCSKIKAIMNIESQGASVSCCCADIAVEKEIKAVLDDLRNTYGRINGIVQSAGVGIGSVGAAMEDKTEEDFKAAMLAKVQGTWLLNELTKGDDLDFYVLFSSAITMVGGVGAGDYTASNTYLDAFAAYGRMQGRRVTTINWPMWRYVADKNNALANEHKQVFKIISHQTAMKAFENILNVDLPRVIVGEFNYASDIFQFKALMPFKLSPRIDRDIESINRQKLLKAGTSEMILPENVELKGRQDSRYTDMEQQVACVFGEVMGFKEVDIYDNFYELGGDSIIAMKIVNSLNKRLKTKFELTRLLKNPVISEFAHSLEDACRQETGMRNGYSSIQPIEEREYYPLSSGQKRLFIIEQLGGTGVTYNIPVVMMIEGCLDRECFENAFSQMIARHETLRTSFALRDDEPVQIIHKNADLRVDYMEADENMLEGIIKTFIQPFDLTRAPLIRVGLVKVREDRHVMMVSMHHIISDGVSIGILYKEFVGLYSGLQVPKLRIQYRDYTTWQDKLLNSEEIKRQENHWLDVFKGKIPVLDMPADYPRPSMQSFEGDCIPFEIDADLTGKLNGITAETGATIYMLVLAAYNILLSRYTGQEDIVVGSPIAGRPHADLANIIGMFVNTLAMRNYPDKDKTFRQFLEEVRQNALKAYENQDYQFEELIEKLDVARDLSRNPLFDTMYSHQDMDMSTKGIPGLEFKPYEFSNPIAKFDLALYSAVSETNIIFNLEYCTSLFKKESIERMAGHFLKILEQIAENPELKLSEIDMVKEEEKRRINSVFNSGKVDFPEDRTVHQLFEEQAERSPDSIAVTCNGEVLSYGELNRKCNRLARLLIDRGVTRDSTVAVFCDRSIEMLVGILGIFKAGGAYVPIDIRYPAGRVVTMLSECGTRVLLTTSSAVESYEAFYRDILPAVEDVIYLDCFSGSQEGISHVRIADASDIGRYSGENTSCVNLPSDLSYVIYTSGSSGRPKGAMVEHIGMMNHIQAKINDLHLTGKCVVAQNASHCFDISVWQFLAALTVGGKTVIYPNEMAMNPQAFIEQIIKDRITILEVVPSYLSVMLDSLELRHRNFEALDYILATGETLKRSLVERWFRLYPGIKMVNAYGPTEASDDITHYVMDRTPDIQNIPIGRPLQNFKIYIVDKNMRLCPVGVPGELWVAGIGVGRGYINNPEKTAQVFATDPFTEEGMVRLYKTGDLARWMEDGNIEFLGRMDYQVKIRGFRIELGEIESHLIRLDTVKEVVVMDREDASESKYLCAYIVSSEELMTAQIREQLAKELPDYMIPSHFVRLEKIPLTPNGKIDRKALPEPERAETGIEYAAPANKTEERIAEIWREILGIERIGATDNFFELGGHSLRATTLISKIHKEFNVEIPLREVFRTPTVRGLSLHIKDAELSTYSKIGPVEEQEYYETSSAQKRFYILEQYEGVSTSYNVSMTVLIEGDIDLQRLEKAFADLIRRHESLRTTFDFVDGRPVQKVHREVEFKLSYFTEPEESRIKDIAKGFITPFDLSKAPLMRVGIVKVDNRKHVLLFDMHHIISDGVSMDIIVKELTALYEGKDLPELHIQYKDFSAWQNSLLENGVIKKQEEYWLDVFKGELPVLDMPTDFPRPLIQSFEGDRINFDLDDELSDGLRKLMLESGATLYMVNLAVYSILLSRYAGQEDIIVGTPVAGRSHADLSNIIGLFVNTLAMRNYPEGHKSFKEFLEEVRTNALSAYESQDYQFEELVGKLKLQRDLSRNPLFDTMLEIQNTEVPVIEVGDLKFVPYDFETRKSIFDIRFEILDKGDRVGYEIDYCTRLFKRESVENLSRHFVNIIREIIKNPEIKLSEINMLEDRERKQILADFNDNMVEYPRNKAVCELFEEQAGKTPDKIAVTFEEVQLTYRELNEKASQLACYLSRECGIKTDSLVGVLMERSHHMLISILGILKAGGAYVPIDPKSPEDRVRAIIDDAQTDVVISSEKHMEVLNRLQRECESFNTLLCIDSPDACFKTGKYTGAGYRSKSHMDSLGYVIYTSGSTGKPKGVMVEQAGMMNHLWAKINELGINEDSIVAQNASHCFDISVWQFLAALIKGGRTIIYPEGVILDVQRFIQEIIRDEVTILEVVPSFLAVMLDYMELEYKKFHALQYLIVTGETVKPALVKKWFELYPWIKLVNAYGPTEASDDITHYVMDRFVENESIPIGKPIQNLNIYIVNKHMGLCPVGVKGEIYVSGVGVGRGYLNDPEKTGQAFMNDPFAAGKPVRLYKTGDIGRWLPDGNIEFFGRRDYQVKIRGYRIELGDIESKLITYPGVKEAAVIDKEDENREKFLLGYVVSDEQMDMGELKSYLANSLTMYMVPSYIVQIERMPLTPNGKIDRKALLEMSGDKGEEADYVEPSTATETRMVEIWKEILGQEAISVNGDFFELGGHSLKATTLLLKIHKEFGVKLPLREVFRTPTIKGLSGYIDAADVSPYASIQPVEKREYYPLTSAQRRLYMLDQLEDTGTSYNIPGVLVIEGDLDAEHIEKVFKELIRRHESFRTSFGMSEGEPVQRIHKDVDFKVSYMEAAPEKVNEAVNGFIRPFVLDKAPLLRVGLIKTGYEKHVLMFDMHHIISDGISMAILESEFISLYKGNTLPEMRIQYKDFAVWENEFYRSDAIKKQEQYWLGALKGEIPVLNIPTDYPRPTVQSFEGDSIYVTLEKEFSDRLKSLVSNTGTTLYMILLSIYNILLHKYTEQEDILVGALVAGRPHADLESVIGMFVSTLAIRNYPGSEKTFEEFLDEVKRNVLQAFENQEYQLDELVEKLNIKRDAGRNPLLSTVLVLQNTKGEETESIDLKISQYAFEAGISKFDILVEANEMDDCIVFKFEYCTKLFKKETIERIAEHYLRLLKSADEKRNVRIKDMEILTEDEKKKIIEEVNQAKQNVQIEFDF